MDDGSSSGDWGDGGEDDAQGVASEGGALYVSRAGD